MMVRLAIALAIVNLWALDCQPAWAELSTTTAIHAIMGEARGETYQGKLALAEAIRNRGHFKGVYGLRVPMSVLAKESPATWLESQKAWRESEHTNLVGVADHWFSDEDIKSLNKSRPRWFQRLIFVRKIGGHSFYRSPK